MAIYNRRFIISGHTCASCNVCVIGSCDFGFDLNIQNSISYNVQAVGFLMREKK